MIERTPLPTTLEQAYAYAQKNGRIVPWSDSGHVALTCRNHPELRWSTKNIDYIGARSLFYDLMRECNGAPECKCPMSDLVPVIPENWQSLVIPLRIITCPYCDVEIMEDNGRGGYVCGKCCDSSEIMSLRLELEQAKQANGANFWASRINNKELYAEYLRRKAAQ